MEDRQVQHIFESNVSSAALAPNVACSLTQVSGPEIEPMTSVQQPEHFTTRLEETTTILSFS